MGNRQGTGNKSRKSNADGVDPKRFATAKGENVDPSGSNVADPEKKKRRRRGDRKSKKETQKPTTKLDEVPLTGANVSGDDAIVTDDPLPTVATMKPAELIDEGKRHQDHQLPELITTTTLTAEEDMDTKQDGDNDKTEDGIDAVENNVDRKRLQLTIYRSYGTGVGSVRTSVACVASGSGIGGVVVQRPAPRLDDVKIYRRSRVGAESMEADQLPEPETKTGGEDEVSEKVSQSRQLPDGADTPISATSSSAEPAGTSRKKKDKKGKNNVSRNSKSSPAELTSRSGTAPPRWNFASTVRDYPELIGRRSVKMRWDSVSDTRSRSRSRSSTVDNSPVNAAAAATAGSGSVPGSAVGWCRVSKTEFPDTAAVVRRLRRFEEHFVASFVDRFTSLPVRVQLASVAVAVRHVPELVLGSTIVVSLQQYLRMSASSLAAEIESRRDYVIIIPEELFREAQTTRCQLADGADITTGSGPALAREAATTAASLAADEISRMFEYQIALIGLSDGPIKMLAEHAADCVIDYVIGRQNRPTSRLLDRNTIVEGVLLGRPVHSKKTFISVVVGQRELKWNLQEIFLCPGLRRETLLFPDDDSSSPAVSTPSTIVSQQQQQQQQPERIVGRCGVRRPPWTCHTVSAATAAVTGGARRCDPLLYGYRGLAVLWDFARGGYTVDESSTSLNYFDEMVVSRYDDFHRLYCPYRRLVGADVMRQHLAVARASPDVNQTTTFADLVLSLHGPAYSRDEIQPIYRPLVTDTVELLPVRRRHSNILPVVRRQSSSSGAAVMRKSVDGKTEGATVEIEKPQIVIGVERSPPVQDSSAVDEKSITAAATSLSAPSGDVDKHSTGGNSSVTPSPTPSSSRLMVIFAESGGNVRRLITDIRQHVKSAKEAARLKRLAAAEAGDSTTEAKSQEQVPLPVVESTSDGQNQPPVTGSATSDVETKAIAEQLAEDENQVPVDDDVFKADSEAVTEAAPSSKTGENANLTVNAQIADIASADPDVVPVGAADCRSHPVDAPPSKWNPDFRMQFPASKRDRFMQAVGTLRAAELTSNVLPEVTTTTQPLDGRDQQLVDVYKLLTNEQPGINGHVGTTRLKLLTITGCHGIGKSALALAVSRRLITSTSETVSGPAPSDQAVDTAEEGVANQSSGRVYEAVVVVECRGCDGTRESLLARIFGAFGLPYRARYDNGDLDWFCRWLSYRCGRCAPRRLLVVLDNLDCPADHGRESSTVIDQLLTGIATLTLLVTSRRSFYGGPNSTKKTHHHQQQYRVNELEQSVSAVFLQFCSSNLLSTDELPNSFFTMLMSLAQMVPDLSNDDTARIVAMCRHVPFALKMAASVMTLNDQDFRTGSRRSMSVVDVGGLLLSMATAAKHPSVPAIVEEFRTLSLDDEDELQQLNAISVTTLAVLGVLDEVHTTLLRHASMHASSFLSATIVDQLDPEQRPLAENAIEQLVHLGLMNVYDVTSGSDSKERYVLPPVVRIIARHLVVNDVDAEKTYCADQLHRLVDLTTKFHSGEAGTVIELIDSTADRDNLVDAVRRLTALLAQTGSDSLFVTTGASDTDDIDDDGSDPWTTLTNVDGATFLIEFLPEEVYFGLYESLERVSRRRDSTTSGTAFSEPCDTVTDDSASTSRRRYGARQCRALCCCAYREVIRGRPGRAAEYAAQAYELLPLSSSTSTAKIDWPAERAFCAYCLALVYRDCSSATVRFNDDGDRGHRLPVFGGPAAAVTLARRAVDGYRGMGSSLTGNAPTGYSSSVVSEIYAAELLAATLADIGQTQSALNACRMSDDLQANALGASMLGTMHPLTVSGTELRRRLWSGLGLVERARRAAIAASESATRYYGTEHPVTAKAVTNVCDAVAQSGAVDDAVCIGIQALALHVKTLGDHVDTAQSYRKLSQLLLRRRLVDAAVMFAEAGVDVLRRIGAPTKEAELEVSRAKGRLPRDPNQPAKSGEQHSNKDDDKASLPVLPDITVATPGESCRRGVTFEQQALVGRSQLVVGV